MVECVSWFKSAGLDEILLFLFIVTGLAFVRVILYVGKSVTESTTKSIDQIGVKLSQLDSTLSHLTTVVMDIKQEMTGEINRIEMRVALAEKDIQFHGHQLDKSVERRAVER